MGARSVRKSVRVRDRIVCNVKYVFGPMAHATTGTPVRRHRHRHRHPVRPMAPPLSVGTGGSLQQLLAELRELCTRLPSKCAMEKPLEFRCGRATTADQPQHQLMYHIMCGGPQTKPCASIPIAHVVICYRALLHRRPNCWNAVCISCTNQQRTGPGRSAYVAPSFNRPNGPTCMMCVCMCAIGSSDR